MKIGQTYTKVRYYLSSLLFIGAFFGLSATESKTLEFQDLLTGEGKPVSLTLTDVEPLTQADFNELISEKLHEGKPYIISVIKTIDSSKAPHYFFFDAADLKKATNLKMVNPLTNAAIVPGDIVRYEIASLTSKPVRIAETAVEPAEQVVPEKHRKRWGKQGGRRGRRRAMRHRHGWKLHRNDETKSVDLASKMVSH